MPEGHRLTKSWAVRGARPPVSWRRGWHVACIAPCQRRTGLIEGMADGVELIAVTKRYGAVTAVDNIDLRIPAGS